MAMRNIYSEQENYKKDIKNVKHPCVSCKYLKACGNTNRTERCEGRELVNGNFNRKHS